MSSTVSLGFTFKTSSARSVHLVGSWDGYRNQLPLSKDTEKRGQWRGVFKMPKAVQNNTYWYYYMIDGYQPTHDPAKPSTVEQTTKRTLNILNLSATSSSKPSLSVNTSSAHSSGTSSRSRSSRLSSEIPHGRSISPSRIVAPRPQRPNATKTLEAAAISSLTSSFASLSHSHHHSHSSFDSDSDSDLSDVPSLSSSRSSSSRRSPISPASSMSSYSPRSPSYSPRSSLSASSSGSCCTCDRFGITRKGERIRMDCGGKVCGSDQDSDCESAGEMYKTRVVAPKGSKRHGVVVRGHY